MLKKSLGALLGLFLFIVLSSCGPDYQAQNSDWFRSTESGKNLSEKLLGKRIKQQNNLFDLFEMKRAYIMGGGKSQAVVEELDRRRNDIVKAYEPKEVIPEKLDFIDWNIKKLSDGQYEVAAYFVVTGKMDRDWICKFVALVDEQHIDMLPPDAQKIKRLRTRCYPDTSNWNVGEHWILSGTFDFAPIPYDIFGIFYLYPEKVYGNSFKYGWYADPDGEKKTSPDNTNLTVTPEVD